MAAKQGSSAGMLPWLGLALVLILLDQFTKVLILGNYKLGDSTYVASFFNIVRAHNTGAAFSFLAGASGWQRWLFAGIAVAAVLLILWMLRGHHQQKLFAFSLACILGGAIGNLVDRLLLYRAPILIGGGLPALADLGLASLAEAHGRWRLSDRRHFAPDNLEIYDRAR